MKIKWRKHQLAHLLEYISEEKKNWVKQAQMTMHIVWSMDRSQIKEKEMARKGNCSDTMWLFINREGRTQFAATSFAIFMN